MDIGTFVSRVASAQQAFAECPEDRDGYTVVASLLYDVAYESVTPEQRGAVKSLSLLWYGGGASPEAFHTWAKKEGLT